MPSDHDALDDENNDSQEVAEYCPKCGREFCRHNERLCFSDQLRDHAERHPGMHARGCKGDPDNCHACKAVTIKRTMPDRLEKSMEKHKGILDRLAEND